MSLFENKCFYCDSDDIKMTCDSSTEVEYDTFKDNQGNTHNHDGNDRIKVYKCCYKTCQKTFSVKVVSASPCCYKLCELNKQCSFINLDPLDPLLD